MLKKLYQYIFRFKYFVESMDEMKQENIDLKEKTKSLNEEIRSLKFSLDSEIRKTRKYIPVADFDITDDEPADEEAFKAYATSVGLFYEDHLKNKIRMQIANVRAQITDTKIAEGMPPMPREHYDWFLRGMESSFWSMNEWGTRMSAQRLVYLQEEQNNK